MKLSVRRVNEISKWWREIERRGRGIVVYSWSRRPRVEVQDENSEPGYGSFFDLFRGLVFFFEMNLADMGLAPRLRWNCLFLAV